MAASEFQKMLDRLLREYYYQELLGLDENNQPRTEMTGLMGLAVDPNLVIEDEMLGWAWEKHVPSWTPKQFNIMWDQFSHHTRVEYVKNLISR